MEEEKNINGKRYKIFKVIHYSFFLDIELIHKDTTALLNLVLYML